MIQRKYLTTTTNLIVSNILFGINFFLRPFLPDEMAEDKSARDEKRKPDSEGVPEIKKSNHFGTEDLKTKAIQLYV